MPLTHSQKNYIKKHIPLETAGSQKSTNSFIFLLALILITYFNSLNNVFLSDDLAEIVNNPKVGNLTFAFTSHPTGFIRLVLYWVAFSIGGLNAALFRSINYIFHTGSVFLIYLIFNKLYSKKLALLVAGIFAVHPAISEAVVWISGGSYPQYTFFFLLSFFCYISASKRKLFYLLSSIFYLLSFMSHPQMPVALFMIFPLWEFLFGNLKKKWVKFLPFLAITIVYLILIFTGLPERETTLKSVHYQEKGIDNPFVLIPIAISSYFELIFFPKILTLYHSELAFGTFNFIIRTLLSLAFLIGILISFKKNKFIFFWLSLFLIALAPTLTPFRLNWIVAERYLYLPIVGILAVVSWGIIKMSERLQIKSIDYVLVTIIIILLSTRTVLRNIDWKNEDNLWIATGKTSPSSPNTHNNLGDVYGRWGQKERSLQEFQTAIALKPNYADAYHNAGNVYREIGQLDKALEYYQKAATLNPSLWQSYQNIAALYFESAKQASSSAQALQQYNLSFQSLQKAISINPKDINLRNNLGVVYLAMGQKDKAKEIFIVVLSADPQNQFAKAGLAETSK